jgi:hypothetical protein
MDETGFCFGILGESRWEELESNGAFELGVFGFVDYAHAPTAKLLKDLVMRYGLPDHEFLLLAEIGTSRGY